MKMIINSDIKTGKINKNIYGHFSEHLGHCIYGGIWVGTDSNIPNIEGYRSDVLEALKKLQVPVLRWPGGCFADEYHWKDGIGDYGKRPKMINTHWGGVVENNHFGTHEFLRFCELIGAEPYVNGNVGSGTVQEMSQWVEYMTFPGESPMANLRKENGRTEPWKLKYFGVGNENWGCGGNMRPEYYADLYRRYATYVRSYSENRIYKIACGANSRDYNWTETVMREAHWMMNGISLHYYTLPNDNWNDKGAATGFDEAAWFATLKKTLFMDELITRHDTIMTKYDKDKRIGLIVDEWGSWYNVEPGTNPGFLYQQNTLRDALIAGINLNIFHKHCDRVQMANIAQMVNVLQSVILTDDEKMVLTPTYHVFEMYKVHQDALAVNIDFASPKYQFGKEEIPQLSASASVKEDVLNISLCNLDMNSPLEIECELRGNAYKAVSGKILTAKEADAHNTFDDPNRVQPEAFTGALIENMMLKVTLPAKSVVVLQVK